jgi:hypothetical protein
MRGHLSGIVVEYFLHDVLRDIAVDEPGAERVASFCIRRVQRIGVAILPGRSGAGLSR